MYGQRYKLAANTMSLLILTIPAEQHIFLNTINIRTTLDYHSNRGAICAVHFTFLRRLK